MADRTSGAASHQGELYGVQMLRGLAALAVVLHHALEMSNGSVGRFSPNFLTTSGASGVDIFFVISGFIMAYVSFPLGKPPISAGEFLRRRILRIYPFYWICCFGMLAIMALGFLKHNPLTISEIARSLVLFPTSPAIISVPWTLMYEVYFYIVFAAALTLQTRERAVWATVLFIGAMTGLGYFLPDGLAKSFFFDQKVAIEFCFGLWIALKFAEGDIALRPIWSLPVFLILLLAPLIVHHNDTRDLPGLMRVVAWGVPASLIVACFLNIARPTGAIGSALQRLGSASYSLYLTHVFVIIAYGKLISSTKIGALNQIPMVVIVVAASVGLAFAVFRFIEQPLLSLLRGFTARRKCPLLADAMTS